MNRILLIFTWLVSCASPTESDKQQVPKLQYANTFEIRENTDTKQLINTEPWPKATVKKTFVIEQPLERVVCTSTSHLPYFEMLDAVDVVVGFPEANYISSPTFLERIESGKTKDLGSGQSLNMELLIGLKPDAVIAFDPGGESNTLEKIATLGIPVIYNSDFLEQTPLGRAEYIKFFGVLLGKEKQADSIFRTIEKNYQTLSQSTLDLENRPTILSGTTYGDTWFLPGGSNWSAQFYKHAGGNYLWENDATSGWLELSFEAVFEKAYDADYWIGVSTFESKEGLKGQDDRYVNFRAFRENNVFNYNKKVGPGGGIDFFESGYSRPDLVLSDLIKMLHPQLLPDHEMIYFQRLP